MEDLFESIMYLAAIAMLAAATFALSGVGVWAWQAAGAR